MGVPSAEAVVVYHKKVMVVLPWWKQVSPITAFCVAQLIDRRRTSSMLNFGDAFIAHSRNSCVDIFLQSPCDWYLTIDDDMIVPFGNAKWFQAHTGFDDFPEKFLGLNAIDRLMSHKKSLVGALYFGRHRNGPPVYNEGGASAEEAAYARRAPYDLVKPTRWVGTGCMLVHRSVFEDIEKKFPRLARGHEAQPQLVGQGRPEDEAPGFQAHDVGGVQGQGRLGHGVDGLAEGGGVVQQRRDVFEHHPGPGEIGDVPDCAFEIHGTSQG